MSRAYAYSVALLASSLVAVAPAHAAGRQPVHAKAQAAQSGQAGWGSGRINRKLVRMSLESVRIHPDGHAIVADTAIKRIELSNGTKVALSYEESNGKLSYDRVSYVTTGTVHVYGAEGGNDVPLAYLDAKQRAEVHKVVAPLRTAFEIGREPEHFNVEFDRVAPGALRLEVAKASAVDSRAARNFLSLRELAPHLVK